MASWQAHVGAFVVRRRVRSALGDMSDIARVRAVFSHPLPAPKGVRFTPATVGGVAGEWVEAGEGTAKATLLYLHGGGYVGCSPLTHRPVTASFALRGFRVFVPDYRLAPEHPFPAAIDDAVAVWRALHAQAREAGGAQRLVVSGDSAGGNLALALMLRLRDAGEPLPAGAALFSPVTDLAGGSASIVDNGERDAMFRGDCLHHLGDAYLAGADPQQPLASPVHADLRGLPPLLLHVGESEALRDDSVRLADRARADDVTVQLRVWPVVPHVWQLIWRLPEARASVDEAAAFLHDAVARAALPAAERPPEDLDVVIVGAGLSGIGAAAHLQNALPQRRYAILEGRNAIGGTWDLFRYPGIRSDSDMYTLGYEFKPWRDGKAIADGPSIRAYVQETAKERGIDRHIRFGHRLRKAEWSSDRSRWLLDIGRGDGPPVRLACKFLWMCSGYYSYEQGHRPTWPGEDRFQGSIVQPQFWPESLDYTGKRVVVIGSGATAVTLVPEMARTAAHVTMLQRSPTYVVSRPAVDRIAQKLKRWLPPMLAYRLVRTKNVFLQQFFFRLARKRPVGVAQRMVQMAAADLPPGYDMSHFTPRYKPWDQRVCLVPDADLFRAISAGTASVVTDTIETFTAGGIRLASGAELEADIVVAATGLQLNLLGDVQLYVDGERRDLSRALVYKGMMFSGVPNLASTFGYTNASWTLKADLTARYVCRLLARMDATGSAVAVPVRDPSVREQPFIDFSSGYVQRAVGMLPKQGDRKPWRLAQNYLLDLAALRFSPVQDDALRFMREGEGLPG